MIWKKRKKVKDTDGKLLALEGEHNLNRRKQSKEKGERFFAEKPIPENY